jgi:hypothetical protein
VSIEQLRDTLFYCTVINFGLLALWGLLFLLPHDWLYRLSGRVFRLPPEQIDAINLTGIIIYKLGVLLFNLVPYLALRLLG